MSTTARSTAPSRPPGSFASTSRASPWRMRNCAPRGSGRCSRTRSTRSDSSSTTCCREPGLRRDDVAGQRERTAAEVHRRDRLALGAHEVDRVADAPHVLEAEPLGPLELDVRLRRAVDVQRPRPRHVPRLLEPGEVPAHGEAAFEVWHASPRYPPVPADGRLHDAVSRRPRARSRGGCPVSTRPGYGPLAASRSASAVGQAVGRRDEHGVALVGARRAPTDRPRRAARRVGSARARARDCARSRSSPAASATFTTSSPPGRRARGIRS